MGGCSSRSILQVARRGPEGACLQEESRDARRCSSHKSGKLPVGEQLPSLLFQRRHSLPSLSSFSSNPAFPLGAVGNKAGDL